MNFGLRIRIREYFDNDSEILLNCICFPPVFGLFDVAFMIFKFSPREVLVAVTACYFEVRTPSTQVTHERCLVGKYDLALMAGSVSFTSFQVMLELSV